MNCLKLHLDVPCVTIPSETLAPIPLPFLFNQPYDVKKPSWCAAPNIPLHFEEMGSLKYREIGNEPYQLIGRNDRCQIILNDVMVSRCHALLLHTSSADSYLLDLNSSHGTYLGNVRLTPFVPTLIKKCSVIRFGSSEQQYLLREYPKVDDVLKKSNRCESVEEKEVMLNTFHNITCLASCTSSLAKLFNRTPTAAPSPSSQRSPQQQQQTIGHQYDTLPLSSPYLNNIVVTRDDDSTRDSPSRDSPASSDELMSICTSVESSSDHSPPSSNRSIDSDNSFHSPSFISPRSTVPQNHFLSLSIPLDLNAASCRRPSSPSQRNQLIDIEIQSFTAASFSSPTFTSAFSQPELLPDLNTPTSEEESIQLRKCLRRSYSVDSDLRVIPPNCLNLTTATPAAQGFPLSNPMLNFGRRTCSVDLTASDLRTQCNQSALCGRKRVRFSLSEIDLAKHQERINLAETNGF
jgi:pSer/pThr/pTyr-binding forkhead associated (FHA) protein